MKRILLCFLAILIITGCSSSNENNDYIKTEKRTTDDELDLIKKKVNVNYEKVVIDTKILKDIKAKSYTIHIEQYEDKKLIDELVLNEYLVNLDGSKFTNNFFNLNNCSEKTCNVEIYIKDEKGGSNFIEKKMNYLLAKYTGMLSSSNIELPQKIDINSTVILYTNIFDDNGIVKEKATNLHDGKKVMKDIINNEKASTIVYLTFSDKE